MIKVHVFFKRVTIRDFLEKLILVVQKIICTFEQLKFRYFSSIMHQTKAENSDFDMHVLLKITFFKLFSSLQIFCTFKTSGGKLVFQIDTRQQRAAVHFRNQIFFEGRLTPSSSHTALPQLYAYKTGKQIRITTQLGVAQSVLRRVVGIHLGCSTYFLLDPICANHFW
jgi:hypothetical protein